MSEQHLIAAIGSTYGMLPKEERIKKIKELVRKDAATKKFIEKFFPNFYKEAYPNA